MEINILAVFLAALSAFCSGRCLVFTCFIWQNLAAGNRGGQ